MEGKHCLGLISIFVMLLHQQVLVSGSPLALLTEDGKVPTGFPCNSPSDCLADECCVAAAETASDELMFNSDAQGVCKKLGVKGSRCSLPSEEIILTEYCPCIQDLKCISSSDAETAVCGKEVGMFDHIFNIFSPNKDDSDNEQPAAGNQDEPSPVDEDQFLLKENEEIEVEESDAVQEPVIEANDDNYVAPEAQNEEQDENDGSEEAFNWIGSNN